MESTKEQQGQGHLLLNTSQGQGHTEPPDMLMEIKTEPIQAPFDDDIQLDMSQFYSQQPNSPSKTNKLQPSNHGNSPLSIGELHGNGPGTTGHERTSPGQGQPLDNHDNRPLGDSNHNDKLELLNSGYRGNQLDLGFTQANTLSTMSILDLGIQKPSQLSHQQLNHNQQQQNLSQQQQQQQNQLQHQQLNPQQHQAKRQQLQQNQQQQQQQPRMPGSRDTQLYPDTTLEESLYTDMYSRQMYGPPSLGDESSSLPPLYGSPFSTSDPSQLHKRDGLGPEGSVLGRDQDGDPDLILLGEEQPVRKCLVCSDEATGMYFGALVCVPCKTFFLRYAGDNFSFVCKNNRNCDITMTTRTQCKYCRYQKCLLVGMCRKERPAKVELTEGQQLCVVCQDVANGVHFGAITCEGCKKFFRRGLTENGSYVCKQTQQCEINPRTRNSCRFCRYQKCLLAGMSREAIQMGRPSKFKPSHHVGPQGPGVGMPYLMLSPGRKDSLMAQRSLSVDVGAGQPPHKMIKVEPPSPSGSMDSFGLSPLLPRLGSPVMSSPLGGASMLQGRRGNLNLLDLSSGSQTFGNTSGSMDSTGIGSLMLSPMQQQLLETLNGIPDNILQAVAQRAVSSTLQNETQGQLPPPRLPQLSEVRQPPVSDPYTMMVASQASLEATRRVFVPAPAVDPQTSSLRLPPPSSTGNQSQLTSSHPGTLSGGVATFFQTPSYLQDNKRYITREPVYNAFVKGALDNKVQLKDRKHKSKSQGGSSSSTSSRLDINSESGGFLQPDNAIRDQTMLDALTIAPVQSEIKLGVAGDPMTPGLSLPPSPGQLDLPTLTGHDCSVSKTETVDCILYNQLETPPTLDSLEGGQSEDTPLSSPPGLHTPEPQVTVITDSVDPRPSEPEGDKSRNDPPASTVDTGALMSPPRPPKPDGADGEQEKNWSSPVDNQTKSPASSSSSSSSSHFGDNGNVYDYVIELTKQCDLIRRKEDSDSEGSEKEIRSVSRGLLAEDTGELTFGDFNRYWLSSSMPDENIMFIEEHKEIIFQVEKVYRQFVDKGTKINRQLRKQLQAWMAQHQGQYSAPPSWINEKVVPIYTLLSVTYCRHLPGFVDFHKDDQSIIIKLGQSQSRILVAAKHWYDSVQREFRDFMSWRGAKKGTADTFKRHLLDYADTVEIVDPDDIEAALLNVLVLIATDYPELRNPHVIEKNRKKVMDSFRAYTTAKYGTPNFRMEALFKLVPRLRELGVLHHRMTFHMRSNNRSTSTSSNP